MIKKTKKGIKDTLWSMSNAYNGIALAFKSERNFRIEIAIVFITILISIFLKISFIEFIVILFAGSSVLGAELFNTAIEESWDKLHPEHHSDIGRIKDIASAAVMMFGLGAGIIGVLVFVRHIMFIL